MAAAKSTDIGVSSGIDEACVLMVEDNDFSAWDRVLLR